MKFVSLHHHSCFSYQDGFGLPSEHVARAAELEQNALALTEHGNVSSHVQLEKAAIKAGIKPIFGCELYTGPSDMRETKNMRKWHMTTLAATQEGYRNLNRLVSRSWGEGFYRWPTVTGPMLSEHNEGLIVTSGCSDGLLACTMFGGKSLEPATDPIKAGLRVAAKFKALFGDRYYLECQQFPELERTHRINTALAEIGEKLKIPLVATADVHYPYPDDNEIQKILHAAGRNTGTVAAAEAEWEYDIRLTLPTSDEFILSRLQETGLTIAEAREAILNTAEIASRCTVTLPKSERIRYPFPIGYKSALELMWQWLRDGWAYRWERNPAMRARKAEYRERLLYEMTTIEAKDFADYFCVVADAVLYAKGQNIGVGPARGSAAASLVCYMLRITEIDPMQFPTMLFERFIDTSRDDLPDIDLDFEDERRDEVRLHLVEKYGGERVGNIGNFTKYRGKNSIDDVSRVYQVPRYESETIKGLVLDRAEGDARFANSLEDTRSLFPLAASVFERYPVLENAIRLEGNYKGMGVHAAGLVVSNGPISDTCAFYTRESPAKSGRIVSVIAYDKRDAEYLGMLKVDFLGLTTMGMIANANAITGMSWEDIYQIPLTDAATIRAFTKADVVGIFQYEGRTTRVMTRDVAPKNFMQIADINALSRPGPLFSGAAALYVNINAGRAEPKHLHPIVDRWTEHSNFQIIYQEQVLGIIKDMGGFPADKVSQIRKVISKSMGEQSFNALRSEFVAGARRLHRIDEELALKVWSYMVTSAGYSFNIAHCVSYGIIAFWSMWLKVHEPLAFYAAQLSKIDNDKAHEMRLATLLRDASRHDINIKTCDLHKSGLNWIADREENAVVAGFKQVPGIGDVMAGNIIRYRDENPGADWFELTRIKGMGTKTIEKILAWVDDEDPFNVETAAKTLRELRSLIRTGRVRVTDHPNTTSGALLEADEGTWAVWMGFARKLDYHDYVEDERSKSGEPVEDILARIKDPDKVKSARLLAYDDEEEDVSLKFNRWRFPKFREQLESLTLDRRQVLIAYGKKVRGFGVPFQVERLTIIDIDED